ncbi:MAG: dihydroxyacetone kinase subunit DhaL [Methylotetracoccus sp.]
MTVSTERLPQFIEAAAAVMRDHAEEVAALDQAIGDGDHVANLQRGLNALCPLAPTLVGLDWASALQKIGMSVMSTVGGASGSLYGTLFLAMAKVLKDRSVDGVAFAEAFAAGVDAMRQRGKAELGEKTMLDVLIPVARTLVDGVAQGKPVPDLQSEVVAVAESGCESTRDLLATKGRASFLGERARGYLDPGARSAQLMISAIVGVLTEPV